MVVGGVVLLAPILVILEIYLLARFVDWLHPPPHLRLEQFRHDCGTLLRMVLAPAPMGAVAAIVTVWLLRVYVPLLKSLKVGAGTVNAEIQLLPAPSELGLKPADPTIEAKPAPGNGNT